MHCHQHCRPRRALSPSLRGNKLLCQPLHRPPGRIAMQLALSRPILAPMVLEQVTYAATLRTIRVGLMSFIHCVAKHHISRVPGLLRHGILYWLLIRVSMLPICIYLRLQWRDYLIRRELHTIRSYSLLPLVCYRVLRLRLSIHSNGLQ